jgi:hypothetical protein
MEQNRSEEYKPMDQNQNECHQKFHSYPSGFEDRFLIVFHFRTLLSMRGFTLTKCANIRIRLLSYSGQEEYKRLIRTALTCRNLSNTLSEFFQLGPRHGSQSWLECNNWLSEISTASNLWTKYRVLLDDLLSGRESPPTSLQDSKEHEYNSLMKQSDSDGINLIYLE